MLFSLGRQFLSFHPVDDGNRVKLREREKKKKKKKKKKTPLVNWR